jgi:predicted NAD/FAD-binding protein
VKNVRQDGAIERLKIAVVGSGISGMSAAWHLSHRHDVTVYEQADRIGGHSNTVDSPIPVDTGFIVYNEANYPNLTALFRYLDVPTELSDMSFAVSLDDGRLEYGGSNLGQLFAQKRNLLNPRFWSMLRDLARFYRLAPAFTEPEGVITTLGAYLDRNRFSDAFQTDHLLPMAAAIWSTPAQRIRDYPAASLIRFCDNHGLLTVTDRPLWRTVKGGSRNYISRLTARYADKIRLGHGVARITRTATGVAVVDTKGGAEIFDGVVIAAHADQALKMLADPSPDEMAILGAFRYSRNVAVLHSDESLMPRRRKVWCAWNYLSNREAGPDAGVCVTYWMNKLQGIRESSPLFVTLNPYRTPRAGHAIHEEIYEHPLFDAAAIEAQRRLWRLQGQRGTWFCGAYFGSGFHEDGLQAGLAAAEAAGGGKRPWSVANESGRIHLGPSAPDRLAS